MSANFCVLNISAFLQSFLLVVAFFRGMTGFFIFKSKKLKRCEYTLIFGQFVPLFSHSYHFQCNAIRSQLASGGETASEAGDQ
jgi:hypothetical protein